MLTFSIGIEGIGGAKLTAHEIATTGGWDEVTGREGIGISGVCDLLYLQLGRHVRHIKILSRN